MWWDAGQPTYRLAAASMLVSSVCFAVLFEEKGKPAVASIALVGDNDRGAAMSKGLAVQAHDLGWDGGRDSTSSGVTYKSEAPSWRDGGDASVRSWRELTTVPPAYQSRMGNGYGSTGPAYSNLLWGQPEDYQRRTAWSRTRSSATAAQRKDGSLQSAINTGLKAAWDHLAGVAEGNGCDAACLKDIYRRAFRAHRAYRKETAAPATTHDTAEAHDRLLFGQVLRKQMQLCMPSRTLSDCINWTSFEDSNTGRVEPPYRFLPR